MKRFNLRFCISKRELVSNMAYDITKMAPDNRPYQMDTILSKIVDKIAELENNPVKMTGESGKTFIVQAKFDSFLGDVRIAVFSESVIPRSIIAFKLAHYFVNSIPEIRALNLSMVEREAGIVDPDDTRRSGKYRVTTMYDMIDKDTWKTDFIDLDALVGNLSSEFESVGEYCTGVVGEEIIQTRMKRYPRVGVRTCCAMDCPMGKYVCCVECMSKDTCAFSCSECDRYQYCSHLLCETNPKKETEDEA